MLSFLIQGLILSVSLLILTLIEFFRMAIGKEMFIDKLISCLQVVHQRTATKDNQMDWQASDLPFKGQVIILHLEDIERK